MPMHADREAENSNGKGLYRAESQSTLGKTKILCKF